MRFRFDFAGDEHRAISTNVSATGTFVKASLVPPQGTIVTLREVYGGPPERAIRMRGEVIWVRPRPTLDEPETGFGVQLVAAWSPVGDEEHLAEFLRSITPTGTPELMTKERDGHRVTVFRFPTPDEAAGEEEDSSEDESTEFEGIDLEHAMDRYDVDLRTRPHAVADADPRSALAGRRAEDRGAFDEAAPPARGRGERPPLLVRPRSQVHRTGPVPPAPEDVTGPPASPKPRTGERERARSQANALFGRRDPGRPADRTESGGASMPTDDEAPADPLQRSASRRHVETHPGAAPRSGERRQLVTPSLAPTGDPPPGAPASSPPKRGWTGLFDTIMAIGRDGAAAEGQPPRGPAPAPLEGRPGEDAVPGLEGADVLLSWKDERAGGRIEKISETMLSVVVPAPGPEYYERVQVVPLQAEGSDADFAMYGTVTRIKEATSSGERLLGVRFTTVDERGQAGVFQAYLQALNRSR